VAVSAEEWARFLADGSLRLTLIVGARKSANSEEFSSLIATRASSSASVLEDEGRGATATGEGLDTSGHRTGEVAGRTPTLFYLTAHPPFQSGDYERGLRLSVLGLPPDRCNRAIEEDEGPWALSDEARSDVSIRLHGSKGANAFRDPKEDRVWVVFDWDDEGWQNFMSDPEVPGIFQAAGFTQGPA